MRVEPAYAEQKMWTHLRGKNLGVRFRRQHPILNKYIIDFYCHEVRLAIELGRYQHDEPEAIQYDAMRTSSLKQIGIRVLRIRNEDVLKNIESAMEATWNCLNNTSPPVAWRPTPPKGEFS